MSKKQNTGKGAAGLAGSSTEGLRSTASAAPKPAKAKPTTGERIARFLCFSGSPDHKVLARRIDRALAAAVRKERERCIEIIDTTPFDHDVTARIRSGT